MTAPTYANDPNGILGTDILFEISDNGVATLTLNRPDAANAITPDQRNLTISLMEDLNWSQNRSWIVRGPWRTCPL